METLDNITSLLGDDLKRSIAPGSRLKIAASCFSIYAYEALREELRKGRDSVEFIFTSPTFVQGEATDKLPKEKREFFIPKLERERSLYGTEFEIQLRNKLTQRAIARECAEWIRRKATFRSNATKSSMQQMACVETTETRSDSSTSRSRASRPSISATRRAKRSRTSSTSSPASADDPTASSPLFDQIWNDEEKLEDVTDQVCDHIADVYSENSPERIYFVMLYNIFSEFLEDITEDVLPNDRTGYRGHGRLEEALQLPARCRGRHHQQARNVQRLHPRRQRRPRENLHGSGCHQILRAPQQVRPRPLPEEALRQLAHLQPQPQDQRASPTTDSTTTSSITPTSSGLAASPTALPLNQVNWGNYDLVVIDESHNFRNNKPGEEETGVPLRTPDEPGDPRRRENQGAHAFGHAGQQPLLRPQEPARPRLRGRVREPSARSSAPTTPSRKSSARLKPPSPAGASSPPKSARPEAILKALDFEFFELLDSVTIARSRKHIEAYYDTTDIGTFPDPASSRSPSARHSPSARMSDGFDDIYDQLSQLDLAVLHPAELHPPQPPLEVRGILRRRPRGHHPQRLPLRPAEGHPGTDDGEPAQAPRKLRPFLPTHPRQARRNQPRTLEPRSPTSSPGKPHPLSRSTAVEDDFDPEDDDLPDIDESLARGKARHRPRRHGSHRLEAAISKLILRSSRALIVEMEKVTPGHDAKLQHLLTHIQQQGRDTRSTPATARSSSSPPSPTPPTTSTSASPRATSHRFGLHTGKVTGTAGPKTTLGKGYDFQSVLTLFSPIAKEKALILPDVPDEIDLVIATDCISEGQNLQDCDYLINYDIHWNPVRIIQRFGRVDRIGSPNESIQLVNYWPDISLDEYINLKERVENRMVIADVTATGSDNVLDPKANEISYRKEQLRKLQDEVIEMEDLKTGISITDLGLNDFRMDLVSYVKDHGDPSPHAQRHARHRPRRSRARPPPRSHLRPPQPRERRQHRPAQPAPPLLPRSTSARTARSSSTTPRSKRLLDLARKATCKGRSEPIPELCQQFNAATKDGREMGRYSDLLDQAIRSMIEVKEEGDIDSLFTPGATTALVDSISGLDDFELIAFLVVQDSHGESLSTGDLMEMSERAILRLRNRGVKVTIP